MLVKLRLQRFGRKKLPHYRIVAAASSKKRDGRFLEIVGQYHPLNKPNSENDNSNVYTIKKDKIEHWLSKGAQPTLIVKNILTKLGFWNEYMKQKEEKRKQKSKTTTSETSKTPIQDIPQNSELIQNTNSSVSENSKNENQEEKQSIISSETTNGGTI